MIRLCPVPAQSEKHRETLTSARAELKVLRTAQQTTERQWTQRRNTATESLRSSRLSVEFRGGNFAKLTETLLRNYCGQSSSALSRNPPAHQYPTPIPGHLSRKPRSRTTREIP